MEELDAWTEEALQEEREGKTIPYDGVFKERMRRIKEEVKNSRKCVSVTV